jgi:hypothetical protein
MSEPFGRADLLVLFGALGDRLARAGVRANVYVVGGAAMALLYDERRVTRDIDSVILEGHGPLTEAVRAIARERGLPSSWLNEQASAYVSTRPDPGTARVFDHPNLVVAAASPQHLLAMKLGAARASDVEDIRLLLGVLRVEQVDAAEAVLAEVFPPAPS